MKIASVSSHSIFDSRGFPTVEATVELAGGARGIGIAPAGASTGRHEAVELRDGDPRRFGGKGVYRAVANVEGEIAVAVGGREFADLAELDDTLVELDGSPSLSRLGANAVLAVSMAAARAEAVSKGLPLFASLAEQMGTLLPLPQIQIFGGGRHADGRVDIQDFMVVAMRADTYEAALEVTFNVYQAAGQLMKRRNLTAGVADEGGYWPLFDSNEAVLTTLSEAIQLAGYDPGREVGVALDIAASELYRDGIYKLGLDQTSYSSEQFGALISEWVTKYPIVSVEDPMAEDDWEGWRQLKKEIGKRCQLVGDDLFTTRIERIERGIREEVANAVLIKPNQIGTVTGAIRAIRKTQAAGWRPIVSARSGETEDAFISHLAVATDAGQLKVGSFSRGERTAKWNEILRIARELGPLARFEGAKILARG